MRNGVVYERQPLAPRTGESDCSFLLPTPAANDYGSTNNGQRGDGSTYKTAGTPSLSTMARRGLLPTPTEGDYKNGGASQETLQRNSRPLSEAVSGGNATLRLQPSFVSWMMGIWLHWTYLEP